MLEIGFGSFVVFALIFSFVLLFMGVQSVPQGMEYTVERFGRYTKTLVPGFNLAPILSNTGVIQFKPGTRVFV